MSNIAAMEQTRMLANTLAQNADPKFQVHPLLLTVKFILHSIYIIAIQYFIIYDIKDRKFNNIFLYLLVKLIFSFHCEYC